MLHEILGLFGCKAQPMMAQLPEAGKITMEDVRDLEQLVIVLPESEEIWEGQ